MSWLDKLTKNRAELSPSSPDDDLRPVVVSLAPVHAVGWARGVIAGLPRWSVVGAYEEKGLIHATHKTRVLGFVDDIHVGFEPHPAGTQVVARSQSRVGKGDFGQNARNLSSLTRALRRAERARNDRLKAGAGTGSGAGRGG